MTFHENWNEWNTLYNTVIESMESRIVLFKRKGILFYESFNKCLSSIQKQYAYHKISEIYILQI